MCASGQLLYTVCTVQQCTDYICNETRLYTSDIILDVNEDWLADSTVKEVLQEGILFYHNTDKKKNPICEQTMNIFNKYTVFHYNIKRTSKSSNKECTVNKKVY